MYSKEFKKLVEQGLSKKTFIGFGNPNAKILIVGKEVSNSDEKDGMDFYNKNAEIWKFNIERNIKQADVKDRYNPLFAYKGLTRGQNKSNTWRNYQKLYDIIFDIDKNLNNESMLNFQTKFFITEMSEIPAKTTNSAQKKKEFKESLERRKNEFFKENDFIKKFPVIILACSNYIWNKENDWQINNIFDVTYDENKIYSKGVYEFSSKNRFWTHYNETGKKLVIHTRQLSNNVRNDMLLEMGKLIKQHLKNL